MKRITLLLIGFLVINSFVFAGGLITNTNQSAAWSRMLVRDASTDIDAVFYNPAGLVKLQDGFHIGLSNQSIFQKQTITSTFSFLNNGEYVGNVSAPLFPSVYLAYKSGRWAISLGLNVVGGGGSANFESGVPMMEVPVAALVPSFASMGVTGYSVDMAFSGRSAYWGLQAGISFAITDNISVFAGARYVMAKNTYEGHMRDIMLTTANGNVRADAFMTGVAQQAQGGADQALQAATLMQPLVDGFADKTIPELVSEGILTQALADTMAGGLIMFGVPEDQIPYMDMTTIQGTFFGANQQLSAKAAQLTAGAALMADQEADVTQTGHGITPILGANFSFLDDDFNIGIKYEFKTKLDMTNSTPAGKGFTTGFDPETGTPIEMFPDGEVTNADIPALLTVGIDYKIIDPLKISIGYHGYFDKQTGWAMEADNSGQKIIFKNFYEIGFGLQYDISENFLVSAGYLHANTGVNQYYQSDLSYSLTSNTVGLGGAWAINDVFKIQLGGYYVMYNPSTYDYTENQTGIPYQNTYDKSTWAISLGLDIAIGAKK
jgi:long-chain fatty acid transport protein